ncbi:hypothetical protein ACLK2F_04405 [Escherichia coli]
MAGESDGVNPPPYWSKAPLPPLTPNPLPKVTTSNSGFTFCSQQLPRLLPDNARAVGIIDHQPAIVLLRYLLDFPSGALSPSMLNTPSVTTSCCPYQGEASSRAQMSDIVMNKTAKLRRA